MDSVKHLPQDTDVARLRDLCMVIKNLCRKLEIPAPLQTQRNSSLWLLMQSYGLEILIVEKPAESASFSVNGLPRQATKEDLETVLEMLWEELGDVAPKRTKKASPLRRLVQKHAPALLDEDSSD